MLNTVIRKCFTFFKLDKERKVYYLLIHWKRTALFGKLAFKIQVKMKRQWLFPLQMGVRVSVQVDNDDWWYPLTCTVKLWHARCRSKGYNILSHEILRDAETEAGKLNTPCQGHSPVSGRDGVWAKSSSSAFVFKTSAWLPFCRNHKLYLYVFPFLKMNYSPYPPCPLAQKIKLDNTSCLCTFHHTLSI